MKPRSLCAITTSRLGLFDNGGRSGARYCWGCRAQPVILAGPNFRFADKNPRRAGTAVEGCRHYRPVGSNGSYYHPQALSRRGLSSPAQQRPSTEHRLKVPHMGDSITEGTVDSWKKMVGDLVRADDVVCVIDTDKVSVDVHSAVSGRVVSHAASDGETVLVGGDLLTIDTTVQVDDSPDGVGKGTGDSSKQGGGADERSAPTSTTDGGEGGVEGAVNREEEGAKGNTTTHPCPSRIPKVSFRFGYNKDRKGKNDKKSLEVEQSVGGKKEPSGGGGGAPPPQQARPPPPPTPPQQQPPKQQPTGRIGAQRGPVERFSDYSDLPERYKRPNLTPQEIDSINSGGATEDFDKRHGKWKDVASCSSKL